MTHSSSTPSDVMRCIRITLCLLAICLFTQHVHAQSFIVKDGVANAQILIAPDAPRTVAWAAKELQLVIEKMTGATLPIRTTADGAHDVTLYVGMSPAAGDLGLSNEGLEHGAFRIASGENWVAFLGGDRNYTPIEPWGHDPRDSERVLKEWDAITGEHFGNPFLSAWRKVDQRDTGLWEFDLDNAGSFYAVNHFLTTLGCRWYLPGPLGEFIPTRKDVPLPALSLTVKPDFELRNIYQMGANFFGRRQEEMRWQLQLRTNQGQGLIGFGPNVNVAHGIKNVIARDEMKQAHPEMYRLIGGRRQTEEGVPCLSSPELLAANVRYLRAVFDHYDVPMQSVMPTDGFTAMCQCDLCAGKETPDRGPRGRLSDYVWGYVTKVAQELYKTHPDKKIHCLAYTTYQLPPLHIDKLPPNVVVGIAQNRSWFRLPEQKQLLDEIRAGWLAKITSGVPLYQYEYYLQEWMSRPWHGLPVLYPTLIQKDLRSLEPISMGEYIEGYRTRTPQPTTMLNLYVTAKMLWDADTDLDSMLTEYFPLMYGPAANPMQAFYQLAEQRWPEFGASDVKQLFDLLDEAQQLAGDSDHGKRITLVREGVTDGLERVRARTREPDKMELPYLDMMGFDADADMSIIPARPLVDLITGGQAPDPAAGSVALAWTGSGLMLRVVCMESDMQSVRALAKLKHDAAVFRDDAVILTLGDDQGNYRELVINSQGIWAGIDRSKYGLDGLGWNPRIDVTATRQADRWIIEAMLPAAALELKPPTRDQPWLINVGRMKLPGPDRLMAGLVPTGSESLGDTSRMLRVYAKETGDE